MTSKHITEESLQNYISEGKTDEGISKHIAECEACRTQLEAYTALYTALNKIEPESFSFNVAEIVMQQITPVEEKKATIENYILPIGLGILILTVLVFCLPYFKIIIKQLQLMTVMTNVFMLASALRVVIFVFMDVFRKYKQGEMMLSQ